MKQSDSSESKGSDYQAPSLVELGTLRELTQTGFTKAGNDWNFNEQLGIFGSVDAGGPA